MKLLCKVINGRIFLRGKMYSKDDQVDLSEREFRVLKCKVELMGEVVSEEAVSRPVDPPTPSPVAPKAEKAPEKAVEPPQEPVQPALVVEDEAPLAPKPEVKAIKTVRSKQTGPRVYQRRK